jgi:intracellular multiplication protein IcmK
MSPIINHVKNCLKTIRFILLLIGLMIAQLVQAESSQTAHSNKTSQETIYPLQPTPINPAAVSDKADNRPISQQNANASQAANPTEVPTSKILKATAFNEAIQTALPLSPEQIIRLRELFNQSQAASISSPDTPPRPVLTSRPINLAPGSTPMVVRLAQGYVSTLAFLDSTGAPWPIENYNIGDPQAFNMQWDKKGNLLMIQATTLYNSGNLVVQLRDLATPVILTLISGQKAVDYRLDLHVQGLGPHAKPLLSSALPNHVNAELLTVLDGIPPANSVSLPVIGGIAQAWLLNERLYLRTRLTVLSPAWMSVISSLEGMRAYELPKVPIVLVTANGQPVQLKIQGL